MQVKHTTHSGEEGASSSALCMAHTHSGGVVERHSMHRVGGASRSSCSQKSQTPHIVSSLERGWVGSGKPRTSLSSLDRKGETPNAWTSARLRISSVGGENPHAWRGFAEAYVPRHAQQDDLWEKVDLPEESIVLRKGSANAVRRTVTAEMLPGEGDLDG